MHFPLLTTIITQSEMHAKIKHSLAHLQDLIPTLADMFCIYILYQPKYRAGGMSLQLVRPNLILRTMQLNAWVANNFMNIEILFYFLYYNVITLIC